MSPSPQASRIKRLHRDQRGVGLVEYVLIAALLSIAGIASLQVVGVSVKCAISDEAEVIGSTAAVPGCTVGSVGRNAPNSRL